MKHQKIDELGALAEIVPFETHRMSRRERLERWADVLDETPENSTRLPASNT